MYAPSLSEGVDSSGGESGLIPRWVFLLNGMAMLIYQTLDNMDGKQARRTGSSSPLGMLFDHGCDAINSPMGSINWCVAMGLGADQPVLVLWTLMSSAIPFYVATWEEYYTGSLVLPYINGPSEGLILGASVSFLSFLYGPHWWHGTSWYSSVIFSVPINIISSYTSFEIPPLSNMQILLITGCLCACQELVLKSISVVRKYGISSMSNFFPLMVMFAVFLLLTTQLYLHRANNLSELCNSSSVITILPLETSPTSSDLRPILLAIKRFVSLTDVHIVSM